MKAVATLAAFLSTPAYAHPGHVAEAAGHSHWLVLGALALALAIGGAMLRRNHRAKVARRTAQRQA